MTRDELLQLTANILAKAKRLIPDRVPTVSDETTEVWSEVVASVNVPPGVWSEAVTIWATELVTDRMMTPKELKEAAKIALVRWESDPQKRRALVEHRERARDERDRQIQAGTFFELRGIRPKENPQPRQNRAVRPLRDAELLKSINRKGRHDRSA